MLHYLENGVQLSTTGGGTRMKVFTQYPDIVAIISERRDGPMGSSTNAGTDGAFADNRMRFLEGHGILACRTAMAGLIHGTTVATVFDVPPGGRVPNTDGLIAPADGPALAITTADCLPVSFAAPDGDDGGWVGIAHAGWPGILGGIVRAMIAKFEAKGVDPRSRLSVAIGPGIRSCCYLVRDDERGIANYRDLGWERFTAEAKEDAEGRRRWRVDLAAIVRHQLAEAGVPNERIEDVSACTACDAGHRFFSRRRGDPPGSSMLSVIRLATRRRYETFTL